MQGLFPLKWVIHLPPEEVYMSSVQYTSDPNVIRTLGYPATNSPRGKAQPGILLMLPSESMS